MPRQSAWTGVLGRLFLPVDIAPLVYFRIVFGAIMLVEVWRYFSRGSIARLYIDPTFHFTYYGFEWVRPWPGVGMYLHFAALGVLAACIMAGLCYRLSAVLFFLGFTYVFLLEQAQYLNHFYLVCLVSFLLIFLPAHRAFSVDAWRSSRLRSEVAPTWALWLLRGQIGIAYIYGGIAKLNADWLQGEPMRIWLADRANRPLVGPLFLHEWAPYVFSYGGIVVDLGVVPLLLWRRTRLLGVVFVLIFNLINAWFFTIGIFPWFMLAATLLFFPPETLRRAAQWLRHHWSGREGAGLVSPPLSRSPALPLSHSQRLTVALLGLYAAWQLLWPFRHFLYPGEVSWTEEGHMFSWHMKLRTKDAGAWFTATDPTTGRSWIVDHRPYLTSGQREEMEREPELILQFTHHLADDLRRQGYEQIQIRVRVMASLNGRPYQNLINPNVNLAGEPRSLLPARWIVPLNEPLPPVSARRR